jgi:hypothetical protein
MNDNQTDTPKTGAKRPYEPPQLRRLGDVPDVTATTNSGTGGDNVYSPAHS